MRATKVVGILFVAGALLGLVLHAVGAPEDFYRWLYDRVLSGLDAPEEPSKGSITAVRLVSLIGSLAQLAAGIVLIRFAARRDA